MTYDYRKEMKKDITQAIEEREAWTGKKITEEYKDWIDAVNGLYDELWTDDAVTGNASGSYTFSTYQAEENVLHNFDLLEEACNEFCQNIGDVYSSGGAEAWDVTIRCYLLDEVLTDVIKKRFANEEQK